MPKITVLGGPSNGAPDPVEEPKAEESRTCSFVKDDTFCILNEGHEPPHRVKKKSS